MNIGPKGPDLGFYLIHNCPNPGVTYDHLNLIDIITIIDLSYNVM